MSTAHEEDESVQKPVSVKVDKEVLEEFDRKIKEAQLDGELPIDETRSDVLRRLINLGIEDIRVVSDVAER